MELIEIIELIGIIIALITGVSSFILSLKSNSLAKKSNKISEDSLRLSQECANMNKENVHLSHIENCIIVSIDNCVLIDNEDTYGGDFCLIVNVLIDNKSLHPVTIKDYCCYLGSGKDSVYICSIDYVHLKEYNKTSINSTFFPIYLNGNESKEVSVAILLSKVEYNQFYAKNGIELSFTTTHSSKKIYIKADNTIDYTK